MDGSLLQLGGDVLGMLLVALEDLQAGLQQALQFGIAGRRNEQGLERAVDRLVIGDLVVDIGLVERGALQLGDSSASLSAAFLDSVRLVSLSSGVTLSFLTRSSACLFTASWSRTMSCGEGLDVLVAGFLQRLLRRGDVDHAGGVGDMRDLRIGRFRRPAPSAAPLSRLTAAIAALNRTNMV